MSPNPDPAGPLTLFHNPSCSKSRQALDLLTEAHVPTTVVEYLETPPDRATLESLVERLEGPAAALVRTGDDAFARLGVDPTSLDDPRAVVDLLVDHPALLQRPLAVSGDRVVIGRPPSASSGSTEWCPVPLWPSTSGSSTPWGVTAIR